MRSPISAPATAAANAARHADALAALHSAGVRLEYAPAGDGPMHLQGHVVPQNKVVLWLADGPQLKLRIGHRTWEHKPRAALLDYFPQGGIDSVRVASGPMHALLIFIEGGWSETPDFSPGGADSQPELQFADSRLHRIASQLQQLAVDPHSHGPAYGGFLAHALIARLQERLAPRRDAASRSPELSAANRRIVVEFLENALGSRVTIDELAALIGYRPPQFMRSFQTTFGMPPHRYLLQQRVARARDLLRASDLALTDIALQLGFASHSHFSTAFRNETGSAPGEYRRGRTAASS